MEEASIDEVFPCEVVIVGGGMVGATLACLLGEAGLRLEIIDARRAPLDLDDVGGGTPDRRVSALTPVTQRLLEGLDVWPRMGRVTPYDRMHVWDAEGTGEVAFSYREAGLPLLGHIVENGVILAALEARLKELPTVLQTFGTRVVDLKYGPRGTLLTLEEGRQRSAPLVVAADGALSPLREMAGIGVSRRDTGQVAVVTSVCTSFSHGGVARQVFLRHGPLAFLPLTIDGDDRYCSIVWSTSPPEAQRLVDLPLEALGEELAGAIERRLGEVTVIDPPSALPLTQRHARHYAASGLVLVGDAAHSIHPLAGQGVNLGMMDAAVLAEELVAGRARGVPLGDGRLLSRYTRRRRGDNTAMLALMDGFRLLFGSRDPLLTLARNIGMSGVDNLSPLKRMLIRQATGHRGRLPASCR